MATICTTIFGAEVLIDSINRFNPLAMASYCDGRPECARSPVRTRKQCEHSKAVQSIALEGSHCFLVLTGDLAHSGRPSQYDAIASGLKRLIESISTSAPNIVVQIVAIPGNHDCDFSEQIESRDLVAKYLSAEL